MKNIVLTAFFCLICLCESSFGCSLMAKYLPKFDETEFIFIGTVRGYTSPTKSGKLRGDTYGLIVDVKESIYLPKVPTKHFEVFPILLGSACEGLGTSIQDLTKDFPVNSEVRIIAKAAEILPGTGNATVIRLEHRPRDIGAITLNTDEKGQSVTSASSIFDYQTYNPERDGQSAIRHDLPSFEIRKDLLRLKNSRTQAERNAILERFSRAVETSELAVSDVFNLYSSDEVEAERYYEKHLEITNPEFYAQYPSYKYSMAELLLRGYDRKWIEQTLREIVREKGPPLRKELMLRRAQWRLEERKRLSGN